MVYECFPEKAPEMLGEEAEGIIATLPNFRDEYQTWYSEALAVVKQLLPDRVGDFVRYYETQNSRKHIDYENYRIEDYLQRLVVTRNQLGSPKIVDISAAIPKFEQQLAILKSVSVRFESSLLDIQQLVQADLLDSELDAALILIKHGFLRGAGAIAGVVLEKHLAQVADNHNLKMRKKHPGINDFNELLRKEGVLDMSSWRQIQQLADIRNLCGHSKETEPKKEDVKDLVSGVKKFTKTLF